jgi:hypothetical protein
MYQQLLDQDLVRVALARRSRYSSAAATRALHARALDPAGLMGKLKLMGNVNITVGRLSDDRGY